MVLLKFRRERHISNKLELNRLERKCEDALSAIGSLERRNSAYTMGIALGTGIIGTGFLALAIYNFMSANPVEPMIQEQLEIAYSACEQAHALLA